MVRRLGSYVHVHQDGVTTVYGPDDAVPAGAAKLITNDKAWVGEASAVAAPPRAGAGSSKDKWVTYAEANGVEVPADATRDDVIVAVEAAGVPTE